MRMIKGLVLVSAFLIALIAWTEAKADDSAQYDVDVIIECNAPKENPNGCYEQMLQILLKALAETKKNHEQPKQMQPTQDFLKIKKVE